MRPIFLSQPVLYSKVRSIKGKFFLKSIIERKNEWSQMKLNEKEKKYQREAVRRKLDGATIGICLSSLHHTSDSLKSARYFYCNLYYRVRLREKKNFLSVINRKNVINK